MFPVYHAFIRQGALRSDSKMVATKKKKEIILPPPHKKALDLFSIKYLFMGTGASQDLSN